MFSRRGQPGGARAFPRLRLRRSSRRRCSRGQISLGAEWASAAADLRPSTRRRRGRSPTGRLLLLGRRPATRRRRGDVDFSRSALGEWRRRRACAAHSASVAPPPRFRSDVRTGAPLFGALGGCGGRPRVRVASVASTSASLTSTAARVAAAPAGRSSAGLSPRSTARAARRRGAPKRAVPFRAARPVVAPPARPARPASGRPSPPRSSPQQLGEPVRGVVERLLRGGHVDEVAADDGRRAARRERVRREPLVRRHAVRVARAFRASAAAIFRACIAFSGLEGRRERRRAAEGGRLPGVGGASSSYPPTRAGLITSAAPASLPRAATVAFTAGFTAAAVSAAAAGSSPSGESGVDGAAWCARSSAAAARDDSSSAWPRRGRRGGAAGPPSAAAAASARRAKRRALLERARRRRVGPRPPSPPARRRRRRRRPRHRPRTRRGLGANRERLRALSLGRRRDEAAAALRQCREARRRPRGVVGRVRRRPADELSVRFDPPGPSLGAPRRVQPPPPPPMVAKRPPSRGGGGRRARLDDEAVDAHVRANASRRARAIGAIPPSPPRDGHVQRAPPSSAHRTEKEWGIVGFRRRGRGARGRRRRGRGGAATGGVVGRAGFADEVAETRVEVDRARGALRS